MNGLLTNYKGELLLGKINTKDLLLLNVLYYRGSKEDKIDKLLVVLKNVKTNEKRVIEIQEPTCFMYVVKEEYRDYSYVPAFRPLEQCNQIRVKYKNLVDAIAEVAGEAGLRFVESCKNNNYKALKNIHKYPYVLGTDYNMESLFRIEWMLHYHDKDVKNTITKSFLDIEVDTIDIVGFPRNGECPINAVSFVDGEEKVVYEFLLRNDKNPQIEKLDINLEKFIQRCHDTFDEEFPGFEYRVIFFDTEILLIQQLFALIKKLKRDFCGIWNMPFDIPYIIDRIGVLGYDPKQIMCDPDFPVDILNYRKDTFHFDFKSKNDSFTLSNYTVFMDQRALYIKVRKGKSEQKSTKLDAIAQKELGDKKIIFNGDTNIKTAAYDDYELFVLYSMKDSLLLCGIEERTHDFDSIFEYALTNGTQYGSVFSQTILLKNLAYISYYQQGYIIGNNRNIDYSKARDLEEERKAEKEEEKFAGALVGDPTLNDHIGVELFGRPSMYVMAEVVDADLTK